MIEFTVSIPFDCDQETVWDIVRDVSSIPKYWQGTRELHVKEVKRGIYEGIIRFAFPSTGNVRITINDEGRTLTFEYLSGPMKGYNIVKVDKDQIISTWKVSMSGILKLFEGWNLKHFKEGTEHALDRIVKECKNVKVK